MDEMKQRDVDVQASIDEALDELRAAQPAPDFLPRLRARLEQDDPRWPRWLAPAAAAIGCAVFALFVGGRQSREIEVARPIEPAPMQTTANGHDTVRLKVDASRRPGVRRVARVRRMPPAPEVLVPASERRAIGRLAAALASGRPEAISLVNRLGARVEAAAIEPEAVIIPPIRIDPVIVSTIPDGAPIFEK